MVDLRMLRLVALLLLLNSVSGCAKLAIGPESSWHQKCGWKAKDYFDDPKVIELCGAIEANDVAKIDQLVAAGANVNAVGKGKMTPLLWAYPDNKLERFQRLLELGADPNVVIESDFNTRGGMQAGDSVTHMACMTKFPGYFGVVFKHGGNPNLLRNGIISNETPIFTLITGIASEKNTKIQLLIEKGADLNHMNGAGSTPAMTAVSFGRQYGIALTLLKSGADPMITRPKNNTRLVHIVIGQEGIRETWSEQQRLDYQMLLEWLTKHGESLEAARADLQRWRSWSHTDGEFRRKMDAEVAARKARMAQEKRP